jgi:hypothetical protein
MDLAKLLAALAWAMSDRAGPPRPIDDEVIAAGAANSGGAEARGGDVLCP